MFSLHLAAEQSDNLKIEGHCRLLDAKTLQGELILHVSDGFKLPKAPDISVVVPKNPKEFKYEGKLEQIDQNVHRVNFTIVAENVENVELAVDCPICSDICTIVSKNIHLAPSSAPAPEQTNILWILLLGFLGGLLLNLMPCILPVMAMKLRALRSPEAILGSIAGNYVSFAAFAACLAFLKIAGNTVGWGMHFQNPYFLEAMTFILFTIALHSFDMIPFFPSLQLKNEKRSAFWGNFLASIIVAAMAIPCTAPFLGTAAAFAIQGSISEMCVTFLVIATGFSVPYFLAFFTSFSFSQKSSKYGVLLKKVMDYGIIVAFLWIFYLLSNYLSKTAITLYVLFFATTTILLKIQKYSLAVLAAVACLGSLAFRDFSESSERCNQNANANAIAQLMTELSKKDQVTIFNITADWCLTCKYTRRVFATPEVTSLLKNSNGKLLEVDMTKKDDALMQFIHKHGRVGIPFTLVYGPLAPNGILLKEIPTVEEVVAAIKKASR
ncbi:MAG: thioredoxin family protein [Holosporaceae bacterium]|nr:thioredoxin family protein [Holosporaceae bacterium]